MSIQYPNMKKCKPQVIYDVYIYCIHNNNDYVKECTCCEFVQLPSEFRLRNLTDNASFFLNVRSPILKFALWMC